MTEGEAMALLEKTHFTTVRKIDGFWWVFTKSFGMPRVLGYEDHATALSQATQLAKYWIMRNR